MKKEAAVEKKFMTDDEKALFNKCTFYKKKLQSKLKLDKENPELEYYSLFMKTVLKKLESTALMRENVFLLEARDCLLQSDNIVFTCKKCNSEMFMEIVGKQKNQDGFMCNVSYCRKCKIKTVSPLPNNWEEYLLYKDSKKDIIEPKIVTNPGIADTISEAAQEFLLNAYFELQKELINDQKKKYDYKEKIKLAEDKFKMLKKSVNAKEKVIIRKYGIRLS
jgi:hypothetical protein